MFDITTELFLGEYYLFAALAGRLIGDDERLFDKLYDVFLLPPIEKRHLRELSTCAAAAKIKSYADYARHCRVRKYKELCGTADESSSEVYDVIAVKGNALRYTHALGVDEMGEMTEAALCRFLTDGANNGIVVAIRILGFLQCEGLFVPRDEVGGIKQFEKAAQWNSVEGIMFALGYNADARQKNIDRLYTVASGGVYSDVLTSAVNAYGVQPSRLLDESKLLKKAFGANKLKSDVYSSVFARFIFSEIIGYKDKERALFSGNNSSMPEIADLPLKLTFRDIPLDKSRLSAVPLAREKEKSRILAALCGSSARRRNAYKPVCICSDSECVLDLYMSAVKKMYDGAHVERIDVADLRPYDFEPTAGNVFLRSCDEDSDNVYMLSVKGDAPDYAVDMAIAFLQTSKRAKFRLQHPSAVIDLSAILPICFCDRESANMLKPYCDVISISSVTADEKRGLFESFMRKEEMLYGIRIAADDAATELLTKQTVDRAARIIDSIVCENRGGDSIVITPESIRTCAVGDVSDKKYGFGGFGHEDR